MFTHRVTGDHSRMTYSRHRSLHAAIRAARSLDRAFGQSHTGSEPQVFADDGTCVWVANGHGDGTGTWMSDGGGGGGGGRGGLPSLGGPSGCVECLTK